MNALPTLRADLLRHRLDDDLMIYDKANEQMHLLNAPTATVVVLLDRGLSRAEIIEKLSPGSDFEDGASVLSLALDELSRAQLLAAPKDNASGALGMETRRQMLQKVAGLGALLAVPAIITLTPGIASAQASGLPLGAKCSHNNDCASGCCSDKNASGCPDKDCVPLPNTACGCRA